MAIRFDQIQLSDDGNHLYPYLEGTDGYLAIRTTSGLTRIGAGNTSFTHFYTDRPSFYFNTSVSFDGDISAYGGNENLNNWNQIYGNIFYAKGDTNYFVDPNSTSYMKKLLLENARISSNEEWPVGHYTGGKEIWSLDPTWTDDQIQQYFGSSNVAWLADSNAPGGWAIKITGSVNVGGLYDSGFPYIPIEEDAIYYMECYIRGFESSTEVRHYMGSQDFTESFGSPSSGSGNPGSFGYWVMSNTASNGNSYAKVHGIIRGHHDSNSGTFETGAKYWTPQALFNYSHQGGTRACVISGWKVIKISSQEYFADGSSSVPSISFAEDKDVGLYRPGGNQLGFITGGGQRLTMNNTNASFSVNVMPSAENSYNIGSASLRWEDLYVDDGFIRNAYIDTYIFHAGDSDNFIEFGTDTISISKPATFAGDATFAGGLTISGSVDSGGTDMGYYQSVGTNMILKGDSNGRSGIFFESEKNGTNVNDPTDYGFIQFHAHGYGGTSGESADMVIGVANDSADKLILQTSHNGGVMVGYKDGTSGVDLTLKKVFHEGYLPTYSQLGTMAYSNLTGTPTIPTNNTQLTNGAGYLTSSSTQSKYLRSDAADTATGQLFFDAGFDSHPIMLSGSQNFDNIDRSGFYNLYNTNTGSTNSPGFSYGTMIAIGNDKGSSGFGFQLAHERLGTGMYVRGMNDTASAWSAWAEVWTSTTDGANSGLDADKLDGQQGSYYLDYNNFSNTPSIPSTSSFVTLTGSQTISGTKTFTSTGHKHSGHYYMTSYDAAGNHYPHFLDGSSNGGVNVNWRLYTGSTNSVTHEWNTTTAIFRTRVESTVDVRGPRFIDTNNTAYFLDPAGGSLLGATTLRQGASDQNNTSDTTSIPSTTGAEFLRIEGNYTNGQYTHEIAKIDRGGNLPLYIRQSKGTANSFTNLARFGDHSNSQKEFEVFGDAQAYSYYTTGTSTAASFYDSDNSSRYLDPGSTGDSLFTRGYLRSSKYKRFANTFDSEYPTAMPMIGGSDSSIGRGYATVGFDTNGRLAIYERVYTIKISGSGWLNRFSNPIPIFPPSGNHFVVVEDFVVYIDYETRTGIGSSGIASGGNSNAYTIGFFQNAQSGNSPGSGTFHTLGVMPRDFVQSATQDLGYYRDVPVHQSRLLPNRGLFLRTGRNCTSTSSAPGGTHYIQIKYRIINTASEMIGDVDYNVNYAGTTSNRVSPLHDVDGSFISY